MSILPLNMPQHSDYVQLCGDSVAKLPAMLLVLYIVTDGHTSRDVLARESFQLGYSARNFHRQIGKHRIMSFAMADKIYYPLAPSTYPSGISGPCSSDLGHATKLTRTFMTVPRVVELPDSLVHELHPAQQDWLKTGRYWLFGFEGYGPNFPACNIAGIATAMVMLDRVMNDARSLDPAHHKPLVVSAQAESDFQGIVGDTFVTHAAPWHSVLGAMLIGMSVTFRALHCGVSPDRTAQNFIASRATFPLAYLGK